MSVADDRPFAVTSKLRIAAAVGAGIVAGLAMGLLIIALLATQVFGVKVLTVHSNSMAPALERGDVVVVRPTALSRITEGDIVLYNSNESGLPIVHRVIAVNRTMLDVTHPETGVTQSYVNYHLKTKGDAVGGADPGIVDKGNFVGEVCLVWPGLGLGPGGLSLQMTLFIIGGLLAVAWTAWELRSWLDRKGSRVVPRTKVPRC